MKEQSDDCIPRRKGFSTPVNGALRIPLLQGGFHAQACAQLLRSNLNEVRNVPGNHRRGERRPSGMMISRRPKRRASSEKAPGPSKTSAADVAARVKAPNVLMWWFAWV